MIINKSTLEKFHCNNDCVLLISVFANSEEGTHAHFDIEVSQMRGYLYPGDAKLGFVETGSVDIYEIKTNPSDNATFLTLKVESFTEDCAIVSLKHTEDDQQNFEMRI